MIAHALTGLGLILASAACGACLMWLWWSERVRQLELASYARGYEKGRTNALLQVARELSERPPRSVVGVN